MCANYSVVLYGLFVVLLLCFCVFPLNVLVRVVCDRLCDVVCVVCDFVCGSECICCSVLVCLCVVHCVMLLMRVCFNC